MVQRDGYKEDFLENGKVVPPPEVGLEHQDDILRKDGFRNEIIVDYLHYSVVISKSNRQALFSAANIYQKEYQKEISSREWFIDPRVGIEYQIGPSAYLKNCWDRGHLTRRADVTWGDIYEAKNASNDSCSYANACPQHENFNQDEWTVPEEVIHTFDKDINDRLCVFTGPIFTSTDRWYTRLGIDKPVRIPSAFWKVVAYVDKDTKDLACQAYLMYQDDLFTADKHGKSYLDITKYQVTITEIELLTGLIFHKDLYDKNPLYFFPREGINEGPEAFLAPDKKKNGISINEGVVFSRGDTEKPELIKRKVKTKYEDFKQHLLYLKSV